MIKLCQGYETTGSCLVCVHQVMDALRELLSTGEARDSLVLSNLPRRTLANHEPIENSLFFEPTHDPVCCICACDKILILVNMAFLSEEKKEVIICRAGL